MILNLLVGEKCEKCGVRGYSVPICSSCFPKASATFNRYNAFSVKERKCIICTKKAGEGAHYYCRDCAPKHPDHSHVMPNNNNWLTHALEGSSYEDPRGWMSIVGCRHCGGLLLVLKSKDTPSKIIDCHYYRRGNSQPQSEPFICEKKAEQVVVELQAKCAHKWITVFRPIRKSESEYVKEIVNNPAESMWFDNDIALIKSAASKFAKDMSVVRWCWCCGLSEMRLE